MPTRSNRSQSTGSNGIAAYAPDVAGGPSQELSQRRDVVSGTDFAARVRQPPLEGAGRDDSAHEQRRLGGHAEHQAVRPDTAQPLGHLGRPADVRQGGLGALVPQLGREPDLQVQCQGDLCSHPETVDVAAADLDGVAVPVVANDLQLASDDRGIEYGAPVGPEDPAGRRRRERPDVSSLRLVRAGLDHLLDRLTSHAQFSRDVGLGQAVGQ